MARPLDPRTWFTLVLIYPYTGLLFHSPRGPALAEGTHKLAGFGWLNFQEGDKRDANAELVTLVI